MKKYLLLVALAVFSITLVLGTGCADKNAIKKALKENPDILVEAIKENPADIILALNEASRAARGELQKRKRDEEQKALEKYYDEPLKPAFDASTVFFGPKSAPITLVEYSDFQCPFCARGAKTVHELMKKYGDKIRFTFKHLPLSFHPQAMIASQYFEAALKQSPDKAMKLHDAIFAEQAKLKTGEKFLKPLAKKLGLNMAKMAKDVKSKAVKDKIAADMKEAEKYGIQGTPGFVINGVPVKGAYPTEHFVQIVEKLKAKGKLKI